MSLEIRNTETKVKPTICRGLEDIPNAWGHQHYNGEYLKIKVDRQVDVNNHLDRYGTLRGFVVRHIEGIKLKGKDRIDICDNCTCGAKDKA